MLSVQDLKGGYGKSQVLFGMSFDVAEGEVISFVGHNGIGKTTIILTLMGMLPAQGGQVSFRGHAITSNAPHVVARLGLGLVPEGRRIFGSLSVEENLKATARKPRGDNGWTLERVMKLFLRLQERRRQSARTLSGGEQQMLAIKRALMINPILLVLDEATEGLPRLSGSKFGIVCKSLNSKV